MINRMRIFIRKERSLILVSLLLCSGLIEIFPVMPPSNRSESGILQTGQETFLAYAEGCLDAMEATAREMSVQGVAVIAFIPGEKSLTWISRMKVVGTLASDNSNFLSVAYSKAGEMAATLRNSGSAGREPLHGEFGYEGGVIEKVSTGYILAVFSGATGEQDTEIARAGLEEMMTAFNQ